MPGQRAKNKRMLGAQVDVALFAAVEKWRSLNPRKSTSDFILEASMAKLDNENIPYDRDSVLADRRARKPAYPDRPGPVGEKPLTEAQRIALGTAQKYDFEHPELGENEGKPGSPGKLNDALSHEVPRELKQRAKLAAERQLKRNAPLTVIEKPTSKT
jgi:hypothetical protein